MVIINENNKLNENSQSDFMKMTLKVSKLLNFPYSNFRINSLNSGRYRAEVELGPDFNKIVNDLKQLGFIQNHKLSHSYSIDRCQIYLDNRDVYAVIDKKAQKVKLTITSK